MLTHCELLEGLHAQIESMQEEINAREHVCRTKRREIEKHRANRPKCVRALPLRHPRWPQPFPGRHFGTESSKNALSVSS